MQFGICIFQNMSIKYRLTIKYLLFENQKRCAKTSSITAKNILMNVDFRLIHLTALQLVVLIAIVPILQKDQLAVNVHLAVSLGSKVFSYQIYWIKIDKVLVLFTQKINLFIITVKKYQCRIKCDKCRRQSGWKKGNCKNLEVRRWPCNC